MDTGNIFRQLRQDRNLSMEELASKARISCRTIYNLERGKPTRHYTRIRVLRALGATQEQILAMMPKSPERAELEDLLDYLERLASSPASRPRRAQRLPRGGFSYEEGYEINISKMNSIIYFLRKLHHVQSIGRSNGR